MGAPDGSEQNASGRPPPAAIVLLSKLVKTVVANARGSDEGLRADEAVYRGARRGVLGWVGDGAKSDVQLFR